MIQPLAIHCHFSRLEVANVTMASAASPSQRDIRRQVGEAASTGDWTDVIQVMEQGQLQDSQKAELIAEVCQHPDTGQATQRLLAVGGGHVTDQALTQLVSGGLWTAVLRLLRAAGDDHPAWTVAGVRVDKELLHAVAEARWSDLTPFLKDRTLSSLGQQRWAVQAVCTRATQRDIILYILPACVDSLLDCFLERLVSRGLWWAVGTLLALQPPVSVAERQRAIQQGVQEATTWEISDFLLPHFDEDLWLLAVPYMLQRKLWWALAKALHGNEHVFTHSVLSTWETAHLESLMAHLVSQNQWDGVQELLYVADQKQSWALGQTNVGSMLLWLVAKQLWDEVCDMISDVGQFQRVMEYRHDLYQERHPMAVTQNVDPSQRAWALRQLCQSAEEGLITHKALTLCTGHEVADVLGHLVNRDFMELAAQLLCRVVSETVLNWTTGDDTETHFWDLVFHCYDVKDKCELYTNVRLNGGRYSFTVRPMSIFDFPTLMDRHSASPPAAARFCNVLCESVLMTVFFTLFCKQGTVTDSEAASDQATSVALNISLAAFVGGIINLDRSQIGLDTMLPVLHRLCVEFGPMAHDNDRNPLFKLHFMETILQTCSNQGKWLLCTDTILLILTCVPVVPSIQRAALTHMMRAERWDVISIADLSYVGEQLRRQLLSSAVKLKQWSVVKQWLHSTVYNDQRSWILKKAEKADQTDIVLLLTEQERPRVTSDTDCQERSLKEMVKQQQWAECRQLIELTVHMQQSQKEEPQSTEQTDQVERVQQCVSALPQLMEENQWLLVAKVLELPVDDAVRRQVMSQAMERGEGSVVSQCLSTMQQQLSDTERDVIFQQAVVTHVLQAVKPLVEEKDVTGLRHRDIALLEAMEQCQWDVVDHCLQHGAVVNMRDEEGRSFMQKLLQGKWQAVEELAKRGYEFPSSDEDGKSLLYKAIEAKQWKAVKALIKQNGDIHQLTATFDVMSNRCEISTPLTLLSTQQEEIIDYISAYSPRVRETNHRGETILHNACYSSLISSLHTLLARGLNPAAVTTHGHSVLSYAVAGIQPQKTLAECIRLGLSTHQPCLTDLERTLADDRHRGAGVVTDVDASRGQGDSENTDRLMMASPILMAVVHGFRVVTQMLYESGACVYRDLFTMQAQLHHMEDPDYKEHFREQLRKFQKEIDWIEGDDEYRYSLPADGVELFNPPGKLINKCARYLLDVSSSPRSLKSTCRLVISHCLKPDPSRITDIQLPVYDSLKRYLMFDDLVNLPPD